MQRRRRGAHPPVDVVVLMSGPMDVGLSGGDMHALRLCDRLAGDRAAAFRILAPAPFADRLPASATPYFVPIHTPVDGRVTSVPIYLLAVIWRMIATLYTAPPARVVVATTHFFFDVLPAAVMRVRNRARVAAYVYHLVQESQRTTGPRNWGSTFSERLSLMALRRVAEVVFVDNEETHHALVSRGFRADQVVMTQNAYDPVGPLPARIEPDRPTVVFIGRLVDVKGVWLVLDLARDLRATLPAAMVSVLGDGPLRAELEQALERDGAHNVELAGFVSEAEKWRRLRSASLMVSPSREEGWGIAVGEALTAGVPAVVYDLPAYRHFGDLVSRVPVGDAEGFLRAATQLLRDPAALDRVRRMLDERSAELPRWDAVLANELNHLRLSNDVTTPR